MTDRWLRAPAVARHFDVKTATLAKWRRTGRGPRDWKHLSRTQVVYPETAVLAYDEEIRQAPAPIQRPPERRRADVAP
jgi:transposase-like protein